MTITRARFIDRQDGRAVLGYSCGHTLCETNANREQEFIDPFPDPFPIVPVAFPARLIDVDANGRKVYGILSECHPAPIEAGDVTMVLKDRWCVPLGVSSVVRIKFIAGVFPLSAACFDPPGTCPEALLFYGGGDSFTGSFAMAGGGTLAVTLTLTGTQDPDRPLVDGYGTVYQWQITFSGCQTPDRVVNGHVSCYYPLAGGAQFGGTLDLDCCADQDSPDLGIKIEGFTARRYAGRLVDVDGVRSKYAVADCCPPDGDCEVAHCCGCLVSPFEWTFDIAGVVNGPGPPFAGTACACHAGTWLLTLSAVDTGTGVCDWHSVPYQSPCVSGPASGMWTLRCNPSTGFVTLSTQNTPGGGGFATYSTTIAAWNCLGPNTMTLSGTPPAICLGWPASVLVSPV